jgi:hypothetical protein
VRILVTGSRDWDDIATICRELASAADGARNDSIVLVSGGAKGADAIAEMYAGAMDWGIEVYPADWEAHGRAAGPIRNIQMVDLGADICVAFIKNNSRGASHCSTYAEARGIPVRRFRA